MARVLVVDDEEEIRSFFRVLLDEWGHPASTASTLAEGLHVVAVQPMDVVFLDVKLPDGDGLGALPRFRSSPSAPEVVIMTGFGDVNGAKAALRNGAWDYIHKPFSLQDIQLPIKRVIQYRDDLSRQHRPPFALRREGIVGNSAALLRCLDRVAQSASTDANVLITGETGTGKELFARAIHENSHRSKAPFVVVDCAALPEAMVEGILFGHEKGAFTGASRSRSGLVLQADGGTLFLDEIGELPLPLQKTFLRVLQEKRFRPLGSSRETGSDFRLIAATHRDLNALTSSGGFREDLLFRIRSFLLELPPLRERSQDILLLAIHHLACLAERYRIEVKGLAPESIEALMAYDWPGNVRELVNALDTAISLAAGAPTLYPKHLPAGIRLAGTLDAIPHDTPRPVIHLSLIHI